MTEPKVDWLLDCEPRDVQMEALRRSYYGFEAQENRWTPAAPVRVRQGPRRGWGHFMEMRLGKTATTLNEFLLFQRDHGVNFMLVLCPQSFKMGWVADIVKFGVLTPAIVWDTTRAQETIDTMRRHGDSFILMMNYEALRYQKTKDVVNRLLRLKTMLVADESIKIKGHSSITSKAAIEMSQAATVSRALTGLPMTQGPQDLYPQLRFVRGVFNTNYFSFRNRFCKMGGFKNKKVIGPKNEDELAEVIRGCAFLAKRKDWADPVTPDYYTVRIEATRTQARHYDEMDRDFVTMLDSGEEVTADQVITKMGKLQQISSGFVYTPEGDAIDLVPPEELPKMRRLIEMLDEEVPGKIVVVYHYNKSGDALMSSLAKYNPAAIRSTAWMKKNERSPEEEKDKFNNDPSCRVIIIQATAGKYGHDLSGCDGARTQFMVFYENTYSLDDRGQLEARILAASQDWTPVYMDFVTRPVEEKAIEALARKESVVTAVLGAYNDGKARSDRT